MPLPLLTRHAEGAVDVDGRRFDDLAKSFATRKASRRSTVASFALATAGGLLAAVRPARAELPRGRAANTSRQSESSGIAFCRQGTTVTIDESEAVDRIADGDFPGPCCPECGACTSCTVEVGSASVSCGAPCGDPCLASSLCREAQQQDDVRRLAANLVEGGFAAVGEPESLSVGGAEFQTVDRLVIAFAHRAESGTSATLTFR